MQTTEVDLIRDALDLACGDGDRASLKRLASVHRVLSRGAESVRPDADLLPTRGIAVAEGPDDPQAIRPEDGRPRYAPDVHELLGIAYRFALVGTKDAPGIDLADFGRFSDALHTLAPDRQHGKKLREELAQSSLWWVIPHTPRWSEAVYVRPVLESGKPARHVDGRGEIHEVLERCDAEAPGSRPMRETHEGATVYYLRPRREDEQPRSLTAILPSGQRVNGSRCESLAAAWAEVERLPAFVVEDGTGLEIRRLTDGALDGSVTFDRARRGWFFADGRPSPTAAWVYGRYVLRE